MKCYNYKSFAALLVLIAVPVGAQNAVSPWELATGPSAINGSGQIVGSAQAFVETGDPFRAFYLLDADMVSLGTLGGAASGALSINSSGKVVGSSLAAATLVNGALLEPYYAFLWYNGVMSNLGSLGGAYSKANDINDSGAIVGEAWTAENNTRAFLYTGGTMADLGTLGGAHSSARAINSSGQIVGSATDENGNTHACIWENGTIASLGLTGTANSEAGDINDAGQIVGWYVAADGSVRGFVWQAGIATDLGTLGGAWAIAYSINDSGQIVGGSGTAAGVTRAFIWQNGAMSTISVPGSLASQAWGITDAGQVLLGGQFSVSSCWMDTHVLVYQNGTLTDLTPDGATGPFMAPDEVRDCTSVPLVDCPALAAVTLVAVFCGFGFLGTLTKPKD